jgi:L-asparagine transporter-like permease
MIALPSALFLLGFFSFHFIFFHFVHSIFLNGFFPLLTESPFGKSIEGTFGYFFDIIRLALPRYWIFILLSGLSRLNLYSQAFASRGAGSMFIPYKNVIRMHITIFVLAFISFSGISNYTLYFVFIIYFLPLGDLFRLFFRKKNALPSTLPPFDKPAD